MASEVGLKVELIHKETIKPSSPTPHHLKTTHLSVFDQLIPETYVPLLLFYPPSKNSIELSHILKTSLSETLSHFYPFAGKFRYNDSICCDDHGAAFIEAQVNCPISKIFDKPDIAMLKQLLPADMTSTQAETDHLLLVQANFFHCGGLAIGVSVSHKVADASTLGTFISCWAVTALGSADTSPHHALEFGVAASLFPPLDFLNTPNLTMDFAIKYCVVKRRFVFGASKIAALKAKAASATVPNPTRVEVVSALIWKCAMEAARSNLPGSLVRPSVWCHPVDMRKMLAGKKLLGNVVGFVAAKSEDSEVDLQGLVSKLRKAIEEFKVRFGDGFSGEEACENFKEFGNHIKRDDVDTYCSSSWCQFPFYAADFGWGKPSWIFAPTVEFKNLILLTDMRDGRGIEVSLTLKEEDMAIIQNNKELLAYACLNPTVVN